MSTFISVDFGGLDTVNTQMWQSIDSIRTELDGLTQTLNVLQSQWTGLAQQAYTAEQTTWNAELQDLVDVLVEATGGVSTANSTYQRADADAAKLWA